MFGPLVMMRCDYVFTYIAATKGGEDIALSSVTVTMRESFNTPKQGHVAFGQNIDEMWVSFVSADGTSVGFFVCLFVCVTMIII